MLTVVDQAVDVAPRCKHDEKFKNLDTRWEQQQKVNDAKRRTRSNSSAPPVVIVDSENNEEDARRMEGV